MNPLAELATVSVSVSVVGVIVSGEGGEDVVEEIVESGEDAIDSFIIGSSIIGSDP